MAVYRCRLIPLTPIHVGAGETIALEDYFLADSKLTRFHPPAVLRAMSDAERNRYMGLLSGGDTNMSDALKLLRECAQKTPGSWIYSIEVGAASRQSLAEALNKVETSRGEVHPLIWNEVRREAVLPGSAIKGAIRTALLSGTVAGTAKSNPEWKIEWEKRLEKSCKSGETANLSEELERELFRQGRTKIEWDPFRFLKVSDVSVSPDHVRVDRAVVLRQRGDNSTRGIQMHFERITAVADDSQLMELEFDLVLEKEEKAWRENMHQFLAQVPSLTQILSTLRFHYLKRAADEINRFPDLYRGSWARAFNKAKQEGFALLRLGRFSHFESLSVEGLRKTQDRLGRWIEEGTSRTYCTPDGTKKMPFGWALLQVL